MSSGDLEGRVAFITGAGSGLGAAFARRLAADGAHIVVNDLRDGPAHAIAEEVAGSVAVFDVTDSAAFDAGVDDAVARLGRLDIMINNAGIAPAPDPARTEVLVANAMKRMEGKVDEMVPSEVLTRLSDAQWDLMIRTHLYGAFHGTRAALRHMQPARHGVIVNVASILGLTPSPNAPHYSAAKAAIIALTKAAAGEVAHLGIRANAVCPGFVDTPLLGDFDEMTRAGITMRIGLGRMARAEELAEMVRFLSGDESSYCTGDVFSASGAFG